MKPATRAAERAHRPHAVLARVRAVPDASADHQNAVFLRGLAGGFLADVDLCLGLSGHARPSDPGRGSLAPAPPTAAPTAAPTAPGVPA